MKKIRIILVDDHRIIRDGLKALLEGAEDMEIVAEAGSAEEFLQKIRFFQADIALVDISLPGQSGIKLTEEISKMETNLKVVILSMHLNEEYIANALKAGAKGYLAKNTTRNELVSAIHDVAQGKQYLGKEAAEVVTAGYIRRIQVDEGENETLSRRETEILKLTAEGLGNKEISEKLFISIRTVESHKNHIMQKLGLKSSVGLVKFAIKNGLIDL